MVLNTISRICPFRFSIPPPPKSQSHCFILPSIQSSRYTPPPPHDILLLPPFSLLLTLPSPTRRPQPASIYPLGICCVADFFGDKQTHDLQRHLTSPLVLTTAGRLRRTLKSLFVPLRIPPQDEITVSLTEAVIGFGYLASDLKNLVSCQNVA
ncbi:hypothetical protein BDD12DRAFT_345094 [Trichophaea hybrida]|nr:hypothetical protein BDD12DRAFT_345094 [Trichophaea hybrida]